MGSCTRRHFLLSTCFLQMITIIERQVFDFLGYMWAPIFVNFFHILFIIFGFYGAYHFRIKYIITYLIWNFLWIGWNSFLICFYLNVGILDRDSDLLNLGTGSVSWFEVNGYGCKPTYNTNITSEDPYRPIRPESVDDCLLTYDIVEVVHSGVQCVLAFFGILGAILISYIFLDEDDRFDFMNGDAKSPQHTVVHPMYVSYTSIPTSASATMLSNKHNTHTHQHHHNNTLSNSNNHLNNSNHAIFTNTTTSNSNYNTNTNTNNSTPTATKKKFSSCSQTQHQQTSLHKQILTSTANAAVAAAAAVATTTNNSNNNNMQQQQQHLHNNSNRNSCNSNNAINSNSNNNNNNNSNTFLIHTHHNHLQQQQQQQLHGRNANNIGDIGGVGGGGGGVAGGSYNGSLVSNSSYQFEHFNHHHHHAPHSSSGRRRHRNNLSPSSRSYTPNPSNASNSLTHMLYSPKQTRKVQPSSTNSIFPANIDLSQKPNHITGYYDDSTAKADHQLYVNGSRRQMLLQQSPTQDTTPSLSYASLQNSNQNLNSSLKQNATTSLGSGGGAGGGGGNKLNSSLSNSNYSLTNSLNNNQTQNSGEGHFARIHSKPKPAKSSSYSSFKHASAAAAANNAAAGVQTSQRPDIKYTQIFNENATPQFDETFEEDNFSIHNLKTDEGITYVPFTKPTPGNYFLTPSSQITSENNNSPHSLNSQHSQNSLNNNSQQHQQLSQSQRTSPNNNSSHHYHDNSGILLEHGAILQPLTAHDLNPAQRALYQQNGLPFHPAYSPLPYRQNSACPGQKPTPRPTNIPLPQVPASYDAEFLSPSEVTPPPPPQPRPHIFQPRTGTAPYPDLSPEVTERYAMPTQYIPRSPVASRIARRQRQQNSHNERSHAPALNTSANFCDQIRDTPPGYNIEAIGSLHTYTISKARSHDRLTSSARNGNGSSLKDKERSPAQAMQKENSRDPNEELAPHVNRRSGRRDGVKVRPRSYCNSMTGGEGVIRTNISNDRKLGYAA